MRPTAALLAMLILASAAGADAPCRSVPVLHGDGTVAFQGRVWHGGAGFGPALTRYRARHPRCAMSIRSSTAVDIKTVERVIALFQAAGYPKVAILIEPLPMAIP